MKEERRFSWGNFRVRLTKRRPAGGGSKVANLRLIQRYRPFSDSEQKIQVKFTRENRMKRILLCRLND